MQVLPPPEPFLHYPANQSFTSPINLSTPFGSPGNRCFLLYFAFFCLGVKMKNPETEAISGFCCKLHFHSAEKERAEG